MKNFNKLELTKKQENNIKHFLDCLMELDYNRNTKENIESTVKYITILIGKELNKAIKNHNKKVFKKYEISKPKTNKKLLN